MASDDAWFTWVNEFARVAHVAPLRQPVPRFGILGKSLTSDLGPGGENLLRVLRASDDLSSSGERLAAEVSRWVADDFEMLESLELVDVDDAGTILALLGDERNGFSRINLANMGEGLSQLLPIITRVLTTPENGSLLIEQPELHLHPAAQADLADLFISGAENGRKQCIVETHSEHLLLRLRRRIAEGVVDPAIVGVLYVERDGSESTVRSLDLDGAGQFEDWPKGFFDERYREALAIAEASSKG
jgi:predicted ATPase